MGAERVEVKIKPMSVNAAWQGRRFKSKAYKIYEEACLLMLPKAFHWVGDTPIQADIKVYLSNKAQDIDGPVKLILDIAQKKYGFDDKHIYRLTVDKIIVPKGQEKWELALSPVEH